MYACCFAGIRSCRTLCLKHLLLALFSLSLEVSCHSVTKNTVLATSSILLSPSIPVCLSHAHVHRLPVTCTRTPSDTSIHPNPPETAAFHPCSQRRLEHVRDRYSVHCSAYILVRIQKEATCKIREVDPHPVGRSSMHGVQRSRTSTRARDNKDLLSSYLTLYIAAYQRNVCRRKTQPRTECSFSINYYKKQNAE